MAVRKLHVSQTIVPSKRVFLPSISVKMRQRRRSTSVQSPKRPAGLLRVLPGLHEDHEHSNESRGSHRSKSFQKREAPAPVPARRLRASRTMRVLKKSRSALGMATLNIELDATAVDNQRRPVVAVASLRRFHKSSSHKMLQVQRATHNQRLLARAQRALHEPDPAEQVADVVRLSLAGKLTLPHILYSHTQDVVLAVLAHPDLHKNPGWFQKFINSLDDKGNTAIHVTAFNNDLVVARELLQASPLLNVLNNRRATPLDLALFSKHHQILKLLLKHGAILGPLLYEHFSYLTEHVDPSTRQLLRSHNQPMVNFSEYATSSMTAPEHLYERPPPFASEEADTAEQAYSDILSRDLSTSATPRVLSTNQGMRLMSDADFFSAGLDL